MLDPADLARFVTAQDPVMSQVLRELTDGRKRSHWMWFVFPQARGLGTSEMAHRYGLASLDEASAYLRHALLGPRLIQCTTLVVGHPGKSARDIFGQPDDLKFRSSMTLFAAVREAPAIFADALAVFYGGSGDPRTLALLG